MDKEFNILIHNAQEAEERERRIESIYMKVERGDMDKSKDGAGATNGSEKTNRSAEKGENNPFKLLRMSELVKAGLSIHRSPVHYFPATDGCRLAYRTYAPANKPKAIISMGFFFLFNYLWSWLYLQNPFNFFFFFLSLSFHTKSLWP
jgi:hypothetical protein